MHEKATGVSNSLILDNARRICHESLVPETIGFPSSRNSIDWIQNISGISWIYPERAKFFYSRSICSPTINLGKSKYEQMEGFHTPLGIEAPSEEHLQKLKKIMGIARLNGDDRRVKVLLKDDPTLVGRGSPTDEARGASIEIPFTPLGAKALRCAATKASEGYPPAASPPKQRISTDSS